jgi:hypothetical protein
MTKEQEIAIIRERLQQLNELEFGTQKAFDAYKKDHDMRPDTKVTVAGNKTTVAQASKNNAEVKPKGKSVFGGNKEKKQSAQPKSSEDIKAFYKKTRKLTDDNNHSEASVELAKFMGDKESQETLEKIKNNRDKRGYLTDKDSKIRSRITTDLLQKAKQQYKGKDYDKITGAF